MSEQIEGIPDGWRVVRIGTPLYTEWFLDSDRKPTLANFDFNKCCLAIVERIKPPEPTYRPFANAAEFEPHRDKWILDPRFSDKKFRVIVYDDNMVWLNDKGYEYWSLFESGTLFEDGTPFGVKVTEEYGK